ncbi:MAG: replicative DNA helicase [Lachnospiraceae bacterium]|nr:replicative DNA helicase [Lachnospiraceae bacterium]
MPEITEEAILKRVMPHNLEAEQSVIGAMLLDQDAILEVSELLHEDDFYSKQYGTVFTAMVELFNERKPVDLVTLQNRLREKGVPPEVSDLAYMKDVLTSVPTSANVRQYATIVAEKATLRRLIRAADDISGSCYADRDNLETILETTEKQIFDICQNGNLVDFVPIREVVAEAMRKIEIASRNGGAVTGIPSGFVDLDYKTAGFHPAELILIAARPSMGKTAFVLNIAQYVAFKKNEPLAIFSLEMSKEQLINRLFALEAKVNAQNLRTGQLTDSDWEKLAETAGMIGRSRMIIDDTPGITVAELRSKCRKYKLEFGLSMVIVDYLQLMSGGGHVESRQQEISEISRSLKALARELEVPVLACAQLSRAPELRPDHRPMLSDLRESGSIEQDADVVMFLYRDEYYTKEECKKPGVAEVIVAKQRNGPVGTVELAWLGEYTKFANLQKPSYDSQPT